MIKFILGFILGIYIALYGVEGFTNTITTVYEDIKNKIADNRVS